MHRLTAHSRTIPIYGTTQPAVAYILRGRIARVISGARGRHRMMATCRCDGPSSSSKAAVQPTDLQLSGGLKPPLRSTAVGSDLDA